MNTNAVVIGGVLVLLAVLGFIFYTSQNPGLSTNATSTPTSVVDTGGTNTPTLPQVGQPVAQTDSAASPTETTVVVTGNVTPNGALTTYWYEFGTTAALGSKTTGQMVGSGNVSIPAPGYITGLTKDTTYYFRLVAENQYGKVSGTQYAFHTTIGTPPPIGSAPKATTRAATGVSRSAADLAGDITPNKAPTQVWFEYGKSATLGNTTPLVSVGNGSAAVPASVTISNLEPATTYYYRVNAQNQFGTVNGAILTLKTSGPPASVAPVVTTQVASPVGTTTATVRGTVNSYSTETKYWFVYGTDALLVSGQTTPQKSAGARADTITVEASISGLRSGTTYYYRIVAQNAAGTVRGDALSLQTK